MQPINVQIVSARAREIRENVAKIGHYVGQPDDDFYSDERNLYTVMHLLLVSIEAVTSICNHLLAKSARPAPASYAECFAGLRELGIVDDTLTNNLIQMGRFRNILVHRYWEVRPDLILRYARENLHDFKDFLKSIGQFLGQSI